MNQIEQMKQMIRDEIQSISNLQERIIFKELMEGVFLSLYETNVHMYQQLEERVMNDLAYDVNQYLIITGIVERNYLDPIHPYLTVMREEDWNLTVHKVSHIRQKIAEEGFCCIGTIFLQCDYLQIERLLSEKKTYKGIIKAASEYPVHIHLQQNQSYLSEVQHLYHLFIKNGIPWQTVNSPYLFKMIDVYITELSNECQENDIVTSFEVDLEAFSKNVCYDIIPIWNVHHLSLESAGFPVACGDHKNYEHVISIQDVSEKSVYLVDENIDITSVRRQETELFVITPTESNQEWNIYTIKNGGKSRLERYTYPIMENLRKDSFAERLQRKNGQVVKTKGELKRFVRDFGFENYLEYVDCILENKVDKKQETYSMNFFLKDEIREKDKQKQLLLLFEMKSEQTWLVRDLMSFITSEVQELYPEYQCGGRLI